MPDFAFCGQGQRNTSISLDLPLAPSEQPSYNGLPCEAPLTFAIRPYRHFPSTRHSGGARTSLLIRIRGVFMLAPLIVIFPIPDLALGNRVAHDLYGNGPMMNG